MDTNTGTPTLPPPSVIAGGGGGETSSSKPTIADAAAAGVAESSPQGPSMRPPASNGAATAQAAQAGAGGVTGAWHNGVTVDALWGTNETRNAFMRVAGVGWKKLYNGRDGAFTALVTLAAQARQTGRTINYRDEADGMVYEIYLW